MNTTQCRLCDCDLVAPVEILCQTCTPRVTSDDTPARYNAYIERSRRTLSAQIALLNEWRLREARSTVYVFKLDDGTFGLLTYSPYTAVSFFRTENSEKVPDAIRELLVLYPNTNFEQAKLDEERWAQCVIRNRQAG